MSTHVNTSSLTICFFNDDVMLKVRIELFLWLFLRIYMSKFTRNSLLFFVLTFKHRIIQLKRKSSVVRWVYSTLRNCNNIGFQEKKIMFNDRKIVIQRHRYKPKKKSTQSNYLREFSSITSLHGIMYLGEPRRPLLERWA